MFGNVVAHTGIHAQLVCTMCSHLSTTRIRVNAEEGSWGCTHVEQIFGVFGVLCDVFFGCFALLGIVRRCATSIMVNSNLKM